MAKSVSSNYLFNLLLNISRVLFPLITAPYVARVLSPEGIGVFSFTGAYASYFVLFAGLGISTYSVREIAKRKESVEDCSKFISQIISIECITTLIASVVYIASIFLLDRFDSNELLFLVAGIAIYLKPFQIEWYFMGREEFGYVAVRSLLIKTLTVILLFFVVRTKDDLINYILLSVFATVLADIWNFAKLYGHGIRIRLTLTGLRQHIKPVLVLFASTISISVYVMLDTLMLGFINDYSEVGYYNTAMTLAKILLPVTTSLSVVAMPRVSSYISRGEINYVNELMDKSLSLVSFLAFPISVGIIIVAPVFVPLFFGVQFEGSVLPLQIGSVVVIVIGLNNLNGVQILTGLGKDKLFLCSVTIGAVVNFLLNLVLIPKFGARGAASASVIAEFIILCVNEYFVRKYTDVRISNWGDMLKSVIGAATFIPVCLSLGTVLSGWVYVITSVVVCVPLYAFMQFILKNKIFVVYLNMLLEKFMKRKIVDDKNVA